MYITGRLAQVLRGMRSYKQQILGLSEMRWTESGRMESEGATILYSGEQLHERGVGIILGKEAARTLLSWDSISDRIIMARIETRFTKAIIVQVYAPSNTAEDEEKEILYEQLHGVLDEIPDHDMKILMRTLMHRLVQTGLDGRRLWAEWRKEKDRIMVKGCWTYAAATG